MSPINCAATARVGVLADQHQHVLGGARTAYKWALPDTSQLVTAPSIRYFKLGTVA
jgi:hypothetical protein